MIWNLKEYVFIRYLNYFGWQMVGYSHSNYLLKQFFFFQAFAEMQVNKLESSKKLRLIEMQTDALKKSKIRFDITDKEISNLNDNTKCVTY